MARRERIFTNRRRRVYRKEIPRNEVVVGVSLLVLLGSFGLWVLSRQDAFDPSERDISMEVLRASEVTDRLYRTPLERWVDPSDARGDAPARAATPLGPFPSAILAGGWTPSSRLQQFDETNLFEKIDGAAPQYIQYGFQGLDFISIASPDADLEINIELYDMSQLPFAMGIFAAQRNEDQALETFERAHFFRTPAGALGVLGPYYFKLTGNQNSDAVRDKAFEIVQALSTMDIESRAQPKLYEVFVDRLNIPFERITFERQDAFQYDFAREFWFARAHSTGALRYYAHESRSAEEAQELFDALLENHLFDYALVRQTDREVVLKHNYLNTYLALARTANFIYGVEKAPDEAVLRESLESINRVLFDDEES